MHCERDLWTMSMCGVIFNERRKKGHDEKKTPKITEITWQCIRKYPTKKQFDLIMQTKGIPPSFIQLGWRSSHECNVIHVSCSRNESTSAFARWGSQVEWRIDQISIESFIQQKYGRFDLIALKPCSAEVFAWIFQKQITGHCMISSK